MKDKKLDHYFYLTFTVSVLLWAFEFWANEDFFYKGFFTSLFLVGSFQIWALIGSQQKDSIFFPLIFLFQAICLLGSSFEFRQSFPFFLSLVPLLAGLYFLQKKSSKILILSSFVLSIFVLKMIYKYVPFNFQESLAFFITLSWISGVLLFFSDEKLEKIKEKFLFHDLLNHTHGISLFLENRQKKGLTPTETISLSRELESFQNILEEHFKKTPHDEKNIIKISEVLNHVKSLGEQFLNGINCEIKTNGTFEEDQIYFNEFFRAMGNIFKNVADSHSSFCEIIIENQANGISIIVKNRYSQKFKRQGSGFGLKSTQELLEKIGGIFCFYSQDGLWVSRIYIPFLRSKRIAA